MTQFDLVRMGIAWLTLLVFIFVLVIKKHPIKFNSYFISRTAIFAAMAVILYVVPIFKIKFPFFPAFLEVHLDEIPILIASFAYGPMSGIFIIIVRTIIKLPFSTTLCVGEIADFIYSLAFVIPASLIYSKNKNFKSAIFGLGIGSLIQIFVASFVTSFTILDFYMFLMGFSEETIISMCRMVNPGVNSLGWTFFFLIGVPFNAFKDVIVVLLTIVLYKKLHSIIDKITKKAQKN